MKDWQKKEEDDAESFEGRITPKSGGYWSFPGDVKTDRFLIDSKTTNKKSYSIKSTTWKKIEHEALKSRKIPLISILLINEGIELIAIDKNDFIELLKERRETKKIKE
jgi:hypothetical protein